MATDISQAILKELNKLSVSEQLSILEELRRRGEQVSNQRTHSILELDGLGREIWEGVDVEEYLRQERDSWNG